MFVTIKQRDSAVSQDVSAVSWLHRVAVRMFFAACTVAPLFLESTAQSSDAMRRPNILIVISDDQGYPDLGCIGTKPVRTPHLDRLAAEGVRATNFYVTWPACTPSRGSILTGRFPQRNGLYDMVRNDMVNYGHRFTLEEYAVSPEMTLGLDVREVTIGDVLHRAGYATGMVGKWDMGQARRFLPLQRGFDFFYGHGNNGIDYYTHERYGVPSMFRGNAREPRRIKGSSATDAVPARGSCDLFARINRNRGCSIWLSPSRTVHLPLVMIRAIPKLSRGFRSRRSMLPRTLPRE